MVRNLVLRNRNVLEKENYIASGQADNYFFNFYPRKLQTKYIDAYGDNFNLIIFGSKNEERDFFIIPFSYVKNIFVDSNLHVDKNAKLRWEGYITNGTLNIKGLRVDVREYFGNLNLLGKYVNIQETESGQSPATDQVGRITVVSDEGSPPGKHLVEVSRIDRDTKIIEELKQLYRNKCQICGKVIKLKSQDYSQAHHLRPLGAPHEGPDDKANIMILCPNHHVEFDYGSIAIDPKTLKIIHFDPKDDVNGKDLFSHKHLIGEEYLRYHYEKIFCH